MNRRNFIKLLGAAGVLAATGLTATTAEKKLLTLDDYPKVEYSREWVAYKKTYFHSVAMRKDNDLISVYELADAESLKPEIINDMLDTLNKGVQNDK